MRSQLFVAKLGGTTTFARPCIGRVFYFKRRIVLKTYLADTNIIIEIVNAIISNSLNKKTNKNIYALAKLIAKRKLQLMITSTVYDELKAGEKKDGGLAMRFVQNYCYFHYLTDEEEKLANQLTIGYLTGEDSAIKDRTGKKNNYKDARVLAEATVTYNTSKMKIDKFLTKNIKDFDNYNQIEYIDKEFDLKSIPINSNHTNNNELEI